MPLSLKSNANFTSIAGAVPGPYGPLTRVGDMPDLNLNSHMPIEVTSALGATLYISYDDMVDVSVRDKILQMAHNETIYQLHQIVNVVKTYLDTADNSAWYSNTEGANAMEMLRYFAPIFALLPISGYLEYDGVPVNPSYVETEDLLEVTFENTSTGEAKYYLWDFGDGTTSMEEGFEGDEVVHTFATAGSKTVKLTAIGPGGVKTFSKTFSISAT